jgi:hypothetical protein
LRRGCAPSTPDYEVVAALRDLFAGLLFTAQIAQAAAGDGEDDDL